MNITGAQIYRKLDNSFEGAGYSAGYAATFVGRAMPLYMAGAHGFSFQIYHEAITGTYKIEASDDPRADPNHDDTANADWYDVTSVIHAISPITHPAGTATTDVINVTNLRMSYVRLSYTHSSGSSKILRAYFAAPSIG